MKNNFFEIGDRVAVLDDVIEGVVKQIKNDQITIETNDNFTMTFFVNELVKINKMNDLGDIFSSKSLTEVLSDKNSPKKHKTVKIKPSKKEDFVLEVDLHIEKLVPSTRGMSNYDILNIQISLVNDGKNGLFNC